MQQEVVEWRGGPYRARGFIGDKIRFWVVYKGFSYAVWAYKDTGTHGVMSEESFELLSEAKHYCEMVALTGAV